MSTTATTMTGPTDVDERMVAQAALDAAEEQLRSLCASHAGTFVSVERRGASLERSLQKLQSAAKGLEPQVEAAQQALEDDDATLSRLSEKHRVRRRTLLQHSSLLELLELPSLMDACVRSNLYEEALNIAAFANVLERRHSSSSDSRNVVVENVVSQIRTRQSDLRRHLLHRLKQDVTMPQCLEVVTALRRLNSIDLERMEDQNQEDRLHASLEHKLKVDFLEARDVWLGQVRSSTGATPSGTVNSSSSTGTEQLLDTIERYRTRVFEIATQFNAIFRASPGKQQQHSSSSSSNLLSMWTTRRLHSFLMMLRHHTFTDSADVRDALEASTFFATSLGRLGADFSAQLPPLLEPHLLRLITQHWTDGVSTLQETLQVCREAGVASPLTSQTAMSSSAAAAPFTATTAGAQDELDVLGQPPRSLLALPALARFVNSILAGLNELRRCLLPGLFVPLRRELTRQLAHAQGLLQTHERAVLAPGLRGEAAALREVAAHMVRLWDAVVHPYLVGALELALGNMTAARGYLKQKEEGLNEDEVTDGDGEEEEDAGGDENGGEEGVEESSGDVEASPNALPPASSEAASTERVHLEESTDIQDVGGGWNEEGLGDEDIYD